ncbi:amino acid/polyamine transporter I [Pisolithus orientalis]|uniref:amino acid/polyamine transporter I n=1 Tax=Pisolithus orientalis TaxID=936130 RepID=UPI00222593E7|nr:amino acid/polyamine transporter I [Pisolithus orientalis]KAI6008810.1 amino acid/polyamine transporter I [Pisolithus orientalis]
MSGRSANNEKAVAPVSKDDDDEAELARMGYKQELRRELSLLQNFGVSFSIISIITGIPSLFSYGLNTGGPAVMVWGWLIVCHAHPTSGGPYYWAAMLANPESAPLASWITGWFNLLGQVAVTTGISFACANFLSTVAEFGTSFVPTPKTTIGIYAAVLVSQGLINTFGVHLLKYLNNVSVWWHSLGTTSLVIAILARAPKHQSANFVFRTFIDGTGVNGNEGWGTRASHAYVCIIGILMAQYTLTEETHNAAMAGSVGIIMALGVSAVLGWFLILGLLFSIQDLETTLSSSTGEPVAQIFLDTVGEKGAIVLMVIVIGAMYFCGTFSVTSNSRMMFAFARDGGIPGHNFFRRVDAKRGNPVRTVSVSALPSLGSSVAFSAATSIATIGLYISYGIPIALRVIYRERFVRGPFHLGAFSMPVAIGAVVWIAFIAIAFILPQANPVDSQTLNYSIVCVGIVALYSVGFWLISARNWFSGPIRQISAAEMGVSKTSESEASNNERTKNS